MKDLITPAKAGLQLRKVGNQYIIVDACDAHVNMSQVYSLNPTAARLWEKIEQRPSTLDELADHLCTLYEVDRATALRDVEQQVAAWRSYGLLA